MLSAIIAGAITFVIVFGLLRLVEYGFHRLRHNTDWSPHWGSWVFAVLAGVYVFASSWGR